jgi:hypothetical protein
MMLFARRAARCARPCGSWITSSVRWRATSDPYPITDEQRQKVIDAYEAMKARLGAGMHRHQVTEPGAAADGDDPRAVAYGAMKRRLGTPKARRARKRRPETFVE